MTEKKQHNPTVGVVGYAQYLHHRIKNPLKVFENSPFIYEEYNKKDKAQWAWFKQNGFKKPYPIGTLSVRIGVKRSDLIEHEKN